jgi:hypothetical protein
MHVATADRGGTLRESLAMGKVYAQARQEHGDSELLDELVASPPAMNPNKLRAIGDVATAARTRLGEARGILEAKATPEELDAYRRFVTSLARAAAEARKEGGFAGIGGTPVSEAEQAALDEIQATLG